MATLYVVYGITSKDNEVQVTIPWIICPTLKEAKDKCPVLSLDTNTHIPMIKTYTFGEISQHRDTYYLIHADKVYLLPRSLVYEDLEIREIRYNFENWSKKHNLLLVDLLV